MWLPKAYDCDILKVASPGHGTTGSEPFTFMTHKHFFLPFVFQSIINSLK